MQFATVFTPFRRLCAIIVNHLEQRGEEASSGLISFEPSSTRSDAKFIIADEPGGGGSGMRRRNAENRMGSILIQHAKLSRYTESDISSMIILASPRCSSPQLLQPCSEMHPRVITSHRQLFVCLLFSARQHAERAICYRPSVRLSVCPSVRPSVCHTGGSVKNG